MSTTIRPRGATSPPRCAATLRVADLSLDPVSGVVTRGRRRIDLTPKQLALLDLLMRSSGRVVSRDTILERVWGNDAELHSNAVTVQISYLRSRIDAGCEPKLIHTRPGIGYVLEVRDPGPRSDVA